MRRSSKIIIVLVLAAVALLRISASTAGNTFAPQATVPYTGYTTTTVTGGTMTSLQYHLDPSRTSITSVTLVLQTNLLTKAVSMSFNGGSSFSCGTGTLSLSIPVTTTYTCTPSPAQQTKGLINTGVLVQ
ncbi:MAG TPA: hypothetical protein VIM08_11950 [Arthrobacter sp.]|jgi:hypothetical protein